jgi:hypothetical protein
MPWRYESDDGIMVIVLDPHFHHSLVDLAKTRIVYVVDTPQNSAAIEECRRVGADLNLCEVNRIKVMDQYDLVRNLIDILMVADTHYHPFPGFVVYGAMAAPTLVETLAERGISITNSTENGFTASIADDAPKFGLSALTDFLAKEKRG